MVRRRPSHAFPRPGARRVWKHDAFSSPLLASRRPPAPRACRGVKLPNASAARVEFAKITEYLLSETHPVGGAKAAFFAKLGFSHERPEELLASLLSVGRENDVVDQVLTPFGTKYVIDGSITGPSASAPLRTVWFIERRSVVPRLVTAYRGSSEGK